MKKAILYTISMLLVSTLCMPVSIYAQKRKQPAKSAKKAEPKEDFSLYTENPICKVMIVDSMVVTVENILQNIPLPSHLGTFIKNTDGILCHQNDFEDQRLFTAPCDTSSNHIIYHQFLTGNKWSEPNAIHINGKCYDYRNPFPMPDGQTLFFAARNADDHEGKCYSLYTTTLDNETGEYLAPQRLPFPFVSSDDDLYYIEDENDSIAWLVTRRNQTNGKACIYTMRSTQPWEYFNADEIEPAKLKSYALIQSIADTWDSENGRKKVLQQINNKLNEYNKANAAIKDIEPQVRKNMRLKAETLQRQLDEYRRLYMTDPNNIRLSETILQAEAELKQIYISLRGL